MSKKPGELSKLNYLYPVLSAAARSFRTIAGTWDTCSPSQKEEILEAMAQLTENVIEVMAASLALSKQTSDENR